MPLKLPEKKAYRFACLLPISVDQPYHTGDQLDQLVTAATDNYLGKLYLLIDAFALRFNFQIRGLTKKQAVEQAKAAKRLWHRENDATTNKAKKIFIDIDWESTIKESGFLEELAFVKQQSTTNSNYKIALNVAIVAHNSKYVDDNKDSHHFEFYDGVKAMRLIKEYIEEKIALMRYLARKYKELTILYPISQNLVDQTIFNAMELLPPISLLELQDAVFIEDTKEKEAKTKNSITTNSNAIKTNGLFRISKPTQLQENQLNILAALMMQAYAAGMDPKYAGKYAAAMVVAITTTPKKKNSNPAPTTKTTPEKTPLLKRNSSTYRFSCH